MLRPGETVGVMEALRFIYRSNNNSLARYESGYEPFISHTIIQVSILPHVIKLLIEFPVSGLND